MEAEFFITPDEVFTSNLHVRIGKEVNTYEKADDKLINQLFRKISDKYPAALDAIRNKGIETTRDIVKEFVRCNFGLLNHTPDFDTETGKLNFERVKCDCRKTCVNHGIICQLL